MRVVFKTNVDAYKGYNFPECTQAPRVGDTIMVVSEFQKVFRDRMLPIRMEVIDVIWSEHAITCELHFKQIDIQIAKQNGVKLF